MLPKWHVGEMMKCFQEWGKEAPKERVVPHNKNSARKHCVLRHTYKEDVATSLHCRITSVRRAQPLFQRKLAMCALAYGAPLTRFGNETDTTIWSLLKRKYESLWCFMGSHFAIVGHNATLFLHDNLNTTISFTIPVLCCTPSLPLLPTMVTSPFRKHAILARSLNILLLIYNGEPP
jgi:hypothetical protein